MKIRKGFVSNSSSSSFVVKLKPFPPLDEDKDLISQDKVDLLLDYGFRYTCFSPDGIDTFNAKEWAHDEPSWRSKNWKGEEVDIEAEGLGYHVICNEDWVFRFLVDNGIPFEATEHYGHYDLWWDGESDFVIKATNFGSVYGSRIWRDGKFQGDIDKMIGRAPPAFEKVPITYWTEDKMLDNEEWEEEDED